jgi:hypothetical protein
LPSNSTATPSITSRNRVKRYKNRSGNSGVVAYEIARDSVTVEFEDGNVYLYTCASAGRADIERMKPLALSGEGLATFISQHVRHAYAAKLR